MKRVADSKN